MVATCFLFANHLNDDSGFCVGVDSQGEVVAPYQRLPIDDIRALQKDARNYVIVSAMHASFFELELPWLSESKAKTAIPYALEEKVGQAVGELHFAFDKEHYQNNHYLVTVVEKSYLRTLLMQLETYRLAADMITVDWFAVKPGEACLTAEDLIINDEVHHGSLSKELCHFYTSRKPVSTQLFSFTDSLVLDDIDALPMEGAANEWIAKRILLGQPLNLCQGEFQRVKKEHSINKWYQMAGLLTLIWGICLLMTKGYIWYDLSHKNQEMDAKMTSLYRSFFPEAKQMISPKFRITQWLKTAGQEEVLWSLLEKLSDAFDDKQLSLQELRYQNKTLFVTLTGIDFTALETLRTNLQRAHVQVTQAQASQGQEKNVVATLELRL